MALQHLRSSTADKRPTPTSMADGQVAINTAAVSPGVFFKDAGGSLVKVGPVHVGTTAPNVSPAVGGHAGNSVGEQWLDTTGGTYVFKVWDGSAWRSETGTFVDVNGDVMTGALGIIAGTAGAPGLYISGDTNTGIYSPGADQVAISTNGVARLTTSTTAVSSSLAIDVPLGAVGTPSITFTGDLNTGIYSPAADTIAFVEGGAEAMRIDSSGRLGLGTSSPSTVFHTRGGFPTATIQRDTGTGAASSLGLTNTTNSGFLITGSDTVFTITASSDVTAGTGLSERLRIDSTGRVGIGTTSPDRLLHVSAADTAYIRLENQDSTGSVDQYVGLIEFEGQDSGGSGVRAQIGGIYEGVSGATALVFGTSADAGSVTERLRINRNGNVGIGTTSPAALLDINGTYIEPGSIRFFANATSFLGNSIGVLSGNNFVFTLGSTERARIDGSGRLLVGTSTSAGTGATFQIRSDSAIHQEIFQSANNTAGSNIILCKSRGTAASPAIVNSGDNLGIIRFRGHDGTDYDTSAAEIAVQVDGTPGANDMPGRLVFSTTADGSASPTERMRITSSGLFQLGTTNVPSGIHEFNWQGSNRMAFNNKDATSANCYGIVISYTNATPNSAGSEFIYCQDATAVRATIRANGGLVNYQANNVNLSDRNAKKDISPASGTWACLKEWEIVNYRYKDQPDDADLNLGVIAQQVAKSCPEVITVFQDAKEATDDVPAQEERLGVKEQQMMWMAIKALQEAQLRIEELEAKVAALEAA